MDKLLTLADLESAGALPTIDVPVKEWGGAIRLRAMTAAERDAWEVEAMTTKDGKRMENIRARLVAICAINADGSQMFATPDAVKKLGGMAAKPVNRLFAAAMKLNALTDEDVEDIRKN